MAADGALQQKLDAWVKSQEFWANAHATRKVPATVFGGGSGTGSSTDTAAFMQLMTVQAAKALNVDLQAK